jgi:hypothetical protein
MTLGALTGGPVANRRATGANVLFMFNSGDVG